MLEILFYAMGVILGISLFAKFISTFTIRKMLKEAAEIQKSNHRLMKLMKAKFEHASMVSDRVQNVGAFVDKYLYEYRILGVRLITWQNISKKAFFINCILGIFSICQCILEMGFVDASIKYIQWTSIFILLLLFVQLVSGEKSQLQATRNYIVEYLENVCVSRYAKRHSMNEEAPEEPAEIAVASNENSQEKEHEDTVIEIEQIVEENKEEDRSQQEMRIRAILEEFLA